MEEKIRPYGTYLSLEAEQEINKKIKEMEDNGLFKIALERAEKWLEEHPEHND
jgi:hypothetical protein